MQVWLVLHSSVLRKSYVDVTGRGVHVIEYDTSENIDDDFTVEIFYQAYLEERDPDFAQVEQKIATFSNDVLGNETLFLEIEKVRLLIDPFS
jgi:hypothetical protein